MLKKIKQWLEPPEFPDDEEKNRLARLMNTVGLYFASLLIFVAIVFVPIFVIHKIVAWAAIAVMMLFYIISRILMFRGRLELANSSMIIVAWVIFEGLQLLLGSPNSPVFFSMIVTTIIISLLIQTRISYFLVIATILIGLVTAILQTQNHDLFIYLLSTPMAIWSWSTLALGFVFFTVNVVTRNLRNALARARNIEVQLQQEISRREITETKLLHRSTHDPLTEIYNRLFFDEELARMEQNQNYPVSIIVADLDQLKPVNDIFGHASGDKLLKSAAGILSSVFRQNDVLARIGGDEFAVLLPQTDAEAVKRMLARVQLKTIEHNLIAFPDPPVQLSLGAATAERGGVIEAFAEADRHMYEDKVARKSGRMMDQSEN